jgi:hypothetical protein
VKGYYEVKSLTSGYGSVRLTSQLSDVKKQTIIRQEVVHLPGLFNLISQSQIMAKDIKVEQVNHYGLNRYTRYDKLIATAPQIDGLFVLDRVLELESSQYTDSDDSYLLALTTTEYACRHNPQKKILWHCRRVHIGLKAVEILANVVADAPKMTGKCDCERCLKCKLTRKPFTPNTTSRATEPLLFVNSDLCSPLDIAIGGGRYMLLFINDTTRHMDEYILKSKS